MKRIEVASGDQYGSLKIVREVESDGKRRFLCQCSCGNEVEVRLGHLRTGNSVTCGRCGIEHDGQRKTIVQWASEYGLKESTLRARLKVMKIGEALKRS